MNFLHSNLSSSNIIKLIKEKKSDFWAVKEKKLSLSLFHKIAKNVPAYKHFLKKRRIQSIGIKNWLDIQTIPLVTKNNYLKKYSLQDLCWDGNLKKPLVFTSTSGSTGEPSYFHRSFDLDWQTSVIHELFYLQGDYKKDEPVLVVVCFSMGVWIGGLVTYQAFHLIQQRGYNVAIITPGINKQEIFNSLKNLGSLYKNIILAGYPPFIKDIIDEVSYHNIDWRQFRVRLLFAAETFTEDFRDYVSKAIHSKNPYLDTMNIYGTADLGAMAFETPLSILVRRLCAKNSKLFELIFSNIQKTPTLCQYIPSFISFDTEGESLLVIGGNTTPFFRYSLGDHGGVYSFKGIANKFKEVGLDLKKEIKKAGIEKFLYELPFVYVYERDDLSTNLYGLQVYPEPIRQALLKKPLSSYLTGKFTLETRFDNKQNQYLLIHLETRKSQNGTVPQVIRRVIVNTIAEQLELKNSEYRELHKFLGKRALPKLQLWPAEDPKYFKLGIKQRWVRK